MLNKKITKYVGIGFLFFLLVIILGVNYLDYLKLEREHKYTIGYIYDIKVRGNGGFNVYYEYKVDNIEITNMETDTYFGNKLLNKRFLVKYQPSNPENCKIMLDYRVRDGVKAPPDGWDSIPIRK